MAGTASVTRPYAAASTPVNTSPPKVVRAAARGFMRAWTVSEMIAAARPSFTSVRAKVASSSAMTMSEAATIPIPPARTGPCTRVTTGLDMVAMRRWSATIRRAPTSMPSLAASARSAPEQNTGPAAVIATTRTSGSASAASSAAISSATSCRLKALRLCWLSRVMVARGPSTT